MLALKHAFSYHPKIFAVRSLFLTAFATCPSEAPAGVCWGNEEAPGSLSDAAHGCCDVCSTRAARRTAVRCLSWEALTRRLPAGNRTDRAGQLTSRIAPYLTFSSCLLVTSWHGGCAVRPAAYAI